MPTIAGDFFFTSMPTLSERALRLLPCGQCGSRGPHGFRIEARYGITALCRDCQPGDGTADDTNIGEPAGAAESIPAEF